MAHHDVWRQEKYKYKKKERFLNGLLNYVCLDLEHLYYLYYIKCFSALNIVALGHFVPAEWFLK